MEQVTLPHSGWRFVAIGHRPDEGAVLDRDPVNKVWRVPTAMPAGAQTVGGAHGGWQKTGWLQRGRSMFVWGFVDGRIDVEAVGWLGRGRRVPVYRVGRAFWVAEAAGHVRHFRFRVDDSRWQIYAPPLLRIMTARSRRQRRRLQKKAGITVDAGGSAT
jgi:hypothetical protein